MAVRVSYEAPTNPDLVLDTGSLTIDECAHAVVDLLRKRDVVA